MGRGRTKRPAGKAGEGEGGAAEPLLGAEGGRHATINDDGTGDPEEGGHSAVQGAMRLSPSAAVLEGQDLIPPELLETGPGGLSSTEAAARLAKFGPNKLEEKAVPKWWKLLMQFTGPMPIMIWLAIGIEAGIRDWPNMGVLLALQLINGLVGFIEEARAGDAVAALKQSLQPKAQVIRDGEYQTIDAELLVPGDRVTLAAGAAVPADCTLVAGAPPIQVDQAALTGESMPVTMAEDDMAKMGSNVVRGECEAVVSATGALTFFGKTAAMIAGVEEMGHFQRILLRITLALLLLSMALVGTCMGYLLARDEPFLDTAAFCVVLLVASIPIAMQVVCTTTMALGSRILAEKKAIVSRLGSIEELAGMNMLCSDKTGTLTLNRMELQDDCPTFSEGVGRDDVLRAAALAAKWREPPKDALDTLVLKNVELEPLDAYEQIQYCPFDPSVKMTSATVRDSGGATFRVAKGAPQVILRMCMATLSKEAAAQIDESVASYAERGIRCLAVGRAEGTGAAAAGAPDADGGGGTYTDDGTWEFLGILTFLDPPRPDTKEVIAKAYELGIAVKMITGDQMAIAKETSRQLAMGTNILSTDVLPAMGGGAAAALPKTLGADFGEVVEGADGFAEVYPEHKFAIVEVLKQRGFAVGMTGDGVNDAPALKKAGIGIAVEGSTDAARAAADIVLTSPGLGVIVEAIVLSRQIFQRMKNYVIYRIACTLQLLLFFFIAIIAIHPRSFDWPELGKHVEKIVPVYFNLPVIALIVITILNDGCIISIAYDRVVPSPYPERWNLVEVFIVAITIGGVAVGSSIMLLALSLASNDDSSFWQTRLHLPPMHYKQVMMLMYLKISLSDFFTVFAARTRGAFFTRLPGAPLAVAAAVATGVSTLISCLWSHLPLGDEMEGISAKVAAAVWIYCLIWFLIQDMVKVGLYALLYHTDVTGAKTEARRRRLREGQRHARQINYDQIIRHGSAIARRAYAHGDSATGNGAEGWGALARQAIGMGGPPAPLPPATPAEISVRITEMESELRQLKAMLARDES